MSSFNVGTKRTYRERGQTKKRKHLGLLEKHRDYVERAQDYKKKKRRLKAMHERAEFRNPDEFYFKMQNSKQDEDGHHREIDKERFSAEEIHLMDKQDLSYLKTQKQMELKKIEKLKASLHGLTSKPSNQHIIFVDSVKEKQEFDPVKHFDTIPEAKDRAYNRPRKSDLIEEPLSTASVSELQKAQKLKTFRYKRLDERQTRSEKLQRMSEAMELRQNLRGKGQRVRVKHKKQSKSGVAIYKWKAERKK